MIKLEDLTAVKLRDLDAISTPEEVLETLSGDLGAGSSKLVTIRRAYREY